MKLGRLPKRNDKRNLKLKDYLSSLPAIPQSIDWSHGITDWEMFNNDTVGDCTCAGAAHLIMQWTANSGLEIVPSPADVLSAYSAITGYNPNDPSTDTGANELDVLNYWRQNGIGNHKIGAYVSVDPSSIDHVKATVYLFGGMYIGVQLPNSAMNQTNAKQVWDIVADDGGIDGGHCVEIVAYDANGLTAVTWGALQKMTWRWWNKYVDECYAVLSNDFLCGNGLTSNGFALNALQQDLKEVSQ